VPASPLVYPRATDRPQNQFYFWPHYRYRETRRGQNAIFVSAHTPPRPSVARWFASFFGGAAEEPSPPAPRPPPAELEEQFASVTDLGVAPVLHRKRTVRWIQLYECRNLR
jgi:hypothetical protein